MLQPLSVTSYSRKHPAPGIAELSDIQVLVWRTSRASFTNILDQILRCG